VRLAHILLDLVELLCQLLVGVLDVRDPVALELDPRLVLLDLEAATVKLEVLVLELPLQIRLVPLYLLHVLLVKLDPLDLEVLEADLGLPLRLGESVPFVLRHQELHLKGLLGLVLAGTQDFLVAELALPKLESLLVQVALAVLDTVPGLLLTYLELSKFVLLEVLELISVLLDLLAVLLGLLYAKFG